ALSFTPLILRTMAKRISSPSVGLCLDVGHANIVANLRRTAPMELIEPVLDRAVLFHLHDNLGARRGDPGSPEIDPLRLDLPLPPGRGKVPWDRLAPLFARKGAAPLLLEVHPPRPSAANLFEAAVEGVAPPPRHRGAHLVGGARRASAPPSRSCRRLARPICPRASPGPDRRRPHRSL